MVNIDYPGVPIDPSSFIEFEFGPETGLEKIELAALVTDDGIVVEQTNSLGFDKIENFNVYPNPAKGYINISYQIGAQLKDLILKVWTADGNLVHQELLPHLRGNLSKMLDTSDWESGIYYLVVQNSDHNLVVQWKLIVRD